MEDLVRHLVQIKGELEITKVNINSDEEYVEVYYMLPYTEFEYYFKSGTMEPKAFLEELYDDISFNGSSMEEHIHQIKGSLYNELRSVGYER